VGTTSAGLLSKLLALFTYKFDFLKPGHCCLEIARTKKRCENLDGCKAGMVETRATSEPCKHPIAVLSNAVYCPAKDQKIWSRKCLMSTKQPQLLDTVGEQILDL